MHPAIPSTDAVPGTDSYQPGQPDRRGVLALLAASGVYLALLLLWGGAAGWRLADPAGAAWWMLACLAPVLPLALPRYRRDDRIAAALGTCCVLVWFGNFAAAFCYLLTSTNAPLVDAALARWDHWLGFDWIAYCRWLLGHPMLDAVLALAYDSMLPQLALLVVYLSYSQRYARLSELCGTLLVCTVITDCVSALFPAAGAAKFYAAGLALDVSMLSHFEPLRSGALTSIDLATLQGLISIPSFHTVLALLFIRAARGSPMALPMLLLNAAMMLATPRFGGHYLVDVLAGGLTVLAAAPLWRRVAGA